MAPTPVNLLLLLLLLPVLAAGVRHSSSVSGNQIRGAWVPTQFGCSSAAECNATAADAAKAGLNTLFLDVWADGTAYFLAPSLVAKYGPSVQGPDHLSWMLAAAEPFNMTVVAWFEYGLMAQYGGCTNAVCVDAKANGYWLGADASGFQWLNASAPDSISLLSGLLMDALVQYPSLLAVQLDDHFAQPAALAGASSDVVLAMTNAATAVVRQIAYDAAWLSPAPLQFALDELNVDWADWASHQIFSVFSPQLYTASSTTFQSALPATIAAVPNPSGRLAVGIRANGSPSPTPLPQVKDMVEAALAADVGVVIWYVQQVVTNIDVFASMWNNTTI